MGSALRLRLYAVLAIGTAVGLLAVLMIVAHRRSQALAGLDQARRACERGDAAGCQQAGWYYEQGALVAPDADRALGYYRRSCDGGYALGCFFAGTLFEGRGQRVRALDHYRRACQRGQADACRSAARLERRAGSPR